jgi:hypothetical protein
MFDPLDLLEIDDKLQENRNKRNREIRDIKNGISHSSYPIITHTAAIKRATNLLNSRYSDGSKMFDDDREVSKLSRLALHEVKSLRSRLEEEDKDTRRFLSTGQLMPYRGEGGYHAILQR